MESLHWEGLTEEAVETTVSTPKGKALHCRDRAKHGGGAVRKHQVHSDPATVPTADLQRDSSELSREAAL